MQNERKRTWCRRQAGASAVEFAILFPVLLAVVYGGITYGFIFLTQQRINFAAQEALRAVVALDPTDPSYLTNLQPTASTAAINSFTGGGTLSSSGLLPVMANPNPTSGTNNSISTVTVTVSFSLTAPTLFPTIDIPGIGPVPAVPPVLMASATARVS